MKEVRSTVTECYLSTVALGGHIFAETARVLEMQPEDLLSAEELKAIQGQASPEGVIIPK